MTGRTCAATENNALSKNGFPPCQTSNLNFSFTVPSATFTPASTIRHSQAAAPFSLLRSRDSLHLYFRAAAQTHTIFLGCTCGARPDLCVSFTPGQFSIKVRFYGKLPAGTDWL